MERLEYHCGPDIFVKDLLGKHVLSEKDGNVEVSYKLGILVQAALDGFELVFLDFEYCPPASGTLIVAFEKVFSNIKVE